ncbi:MAG: DUF3027 domain-containing protein [Candidatus Ancillula sp.]|jgi:hypothetical protein|nr:DUF3027 domain-containing protein [Candidatus Ancillula sp.]
MFKFFKAVIPGQRSRRNKSLVVSKDKLGVEQNPENNQDSKLEDTAFVDSNDKDISTSGSTHTVDRGVGVNKDSNLNKKRKKPATQIGKDLSSAVDMARKALLPSVNKPEDIGEHVDFEMLDDTTGIHSFRSNLKGYKDWTWFVYMSKLSDSNNINVIEVSHLPDDSALLAPKWVPWDQRIKPTDIMEYDELPYDAQDSRLMGIDNSDDAVDFGVLGRIALDKKRVMTLNAKNDVADRWYRGNSGPYTASTRISLAKCMTCGFFIPVKGDLGQLFGVCANLWSRDDARVVSSDHGCGMHSETDTTRHKKRWSQSETVIDQTANVDFFEINGEKSQEK